MSTLCCYKVKASACSGNQQFQLISKEYRLTYKYIFCARKASRIFHYYFAVYINCEGLKQAFFDGQVIGSPNLRKQRQNKNDLTRGMYFASDHSLFSDQCWCCFCNRVYFNILIVIIHNVPVFFSLFSHS